MPKSSLEKKTKNAKPTISSTHVSVCVSCAIIMLLALDADGEILCKTDCVCHGGLIIRRVLYMLNEHSKYVCVPGSWRSLARFTPTQPFITRAFSYIMNVVKSMPEIYSIKVVH